MNTQDLSSAPTVAPKEGDYVRLRNGEICGPIKHSTHPRYTLRVGDKGYSWIADGHYWADRSINSADIIDILPNPNAPEQEGPVRTVTRKEIVPGEYGSVSVRKYERDPTNYIRVSFFRNDEMYRALNADELEAASLTLSQLAQALRGNER